MEVKRIHPKDTLTIRNLLLAPKNWDQAHVFDGDNLDQTFHLGAFVDGKLVSIASFYFQNHPDIPAKYQYRLRGMATLAEFRKKGMSKALIQTGIPIVKQNQCEILWCNARKTAIGFYESTGFTPVGKMFEIPEIGPHQLMLLDLNIS